MNFRWFKTYDEFGRWTQPELQVWKEDYGWWEAVPSVECKKSEEEEYMTTKEM